MDKTPLGGGAMIATHLSRALSAWKDPDFEAISIGSGPQSPGIEVSYVSLKPPLFQGESIALLSELRYARFSRWFERKSARWILERRAEFPPSKTCIIVNDISEAPELSALASLGYPILSIWHVDVVDYFNRLYLKNALPGQWLTKAYEKIRLKKAASFFPDILKLVFEKERETVFWSSRLIFPSKPMAQRAQALYKDLVKPEEFERKSLVVPWGTWEERLDPILVEEEAQRLAQRYQISPESRVLLTVSRISPEKGLDFLIKAVKILEETRPAEAKKICLFICGEPAFMRGAAYAKKVEALAQKLRYARIFFPGYLAPLQKRAFFKLGDLFISPSVHESYGLTLVEAMAGGCGVLSSDHYGARDFIKPEFGKIVSYSSGYAPQKVLAAALDELLKDKSKLQEMGRKADKAARAMRFEDAARTIIKAAMTEIRERERNCSLFPA
jgi:glycosyltransferase involved in cell wall biosynthesis